MKKYICKKCGWEYDPEKGAPELEIKPMIAFEVMPDCFECPVCGALKEHFTKVEEE